MKINLKIFPLFSCLAFVSGSYAPGSEKDIPGGTGTLKVNVDEVLVDVLVTNKKGQLIQNLKVEDFQLYEDGSPQTLTSVREIRSELRKSTGEKAPPTALSNVPVDQGMGRTVSRPINLVTLVFDRIQPTGRKLAGDGAQKYIQELGSTDFATVMVIDRTLRVLVPFTNEKERLEEAVRTAGGGTSEQFSALSAEVKRSLEQGVRALTTADSGIAAAGRDTGGPGGNTMAAFGEAAMSQMMTNILQQASAAEEFVQGQATVSALMSIVKGEKMLPGRKAIIYFAERIALPNMINALYEDMKSAANRANISFYCVDASGLEGQQQLTAMSNELSRIMTVGQRQQRRQGGPIQRDEVLLSEKTYDALRLSAQNTLYDLAYSTGGTLIANTNDFLKGLRQVTADLHFHYELSYAPANRGFDGNYRRIEVKLKRPGYSVSSRQGYYALPPGRGIESRFEIPLRAALEAAIPPRQLTCRTASMIFPAERGKSSVVLYLETPLSEYAFQVDSTKKEYHARISVLLLLKDEQGKESERFSQEVPFQGPASKVEDPRTRNFVFYRTLNLSPGKYTVAYVVRDVLEEKVTVKRSLLLVPSHPIQQIALSSIILVKRMDPASADWDQAEQPLILEKERVVPNLAGEIQIAEWSGIPFFFSVLLSDPSTPLPTVDFVFYKDGAPWGHTGAKPLPAPDTRGIIKYMASLPASTFAPGSYDIQVVVKNGERSATGNTTLKIQ